MNRRRMQLMAWVISGTVAVIAVVAWGGLYEWRLSSLSAYQLFPLFGLLAFSLMWAHYIVSALRRYFRTDRKELKTYLESTSTVVLVALLLHPGLLGWQLWSDGLGLPPGSYRAYIGPVLYSSLLLGVIAWVIFMLYELRRKYVSRPWWRFIQYGSDVAMLLVFIHGLRLGSHLQTGWFKSVWYFYGISLVISLIYIHTRPSQRQKPKA